MILHMNLFRASEPKGFPLFESWYARFKRERQPGVDFDDPEADWDAVQEMLFKDFLRWCCRRIVDEAPNETAARLTLDRLCRETQQVKPRGRPRKSNSRLFRSRGVIGPGARAERHLFDKG